MNKWFESKNFANYAKTALLQAQKKIDQVLDIREDEIANPGTSLNTPPPTTTNLNPVENPSNFVTKSSFDSKKAENESDFFSSFLNEGSINNNTRSISPNLSGVKKGRNKSKSGSNSSIPKQCENDEFKFDDFVNSGLSEYGAKVQSVQSSIKSAQLTLSQTSEANSLGSGVDLVSSTTATEVESNLEESDEKANKLTILGSSTSTTNRPLTPTNSNASSNRGSNKSVKQHNNSQMAEIEKIEKQSWVQNYVDSNGRHSTQIENVQKSENETENFEEVKLDANEADEMKSANDKATEKVVLTSAETKSELRLDVNEDLTKTDTERNNQTGFGRDVNVAETDFGSCRSSGEQINNSLIDMDFVKVDGSASQSGNASSTEEPETCASSDIEVLSLPSNSGDQLLAIQHSSLKTQIPLSLAQRLPSLTAGSVKPNFHFRKSSDPAKKTDPKHAEQANEPATTHKTNSSNVMQIFVKSPPAPSQQNFNSTSSNFAQSSQSEEACLNEASSSDASLKSILDARETHILKLNKQNVKLQEDNDNLLSEIEKMKYEMSEKSKGMQKVQQELSGKVEQASVEREQTKKLCAELQRELAEAKSRVKEKDEQVEQLTLEGLKLSKQELTQSNIIKKLRVKEKENEETLSALRGDLAKAQKELDELRKALEAKEESENKNIEAFKKLEKGASTLEKDMLNTKGLLEESENKVKSLENALQNAYKEVAELHKANATKESKLNETASSIENQLKEEIHSALEKERLISAKKHEALKWELQSARSDLARLEQQHALREDMLRKEINDLQQQLRDSETRNNELSQNISTATRPLLRQIENLQSSHAGQIEVLENAERGLIERLKEAQTKLFEVSELSRESQESLLEVSQRNKIYEAQIQTLKVEKSKLSGECQMLKADMENFENERMEKETQNKIMIGSYTQQIEKLSKEKKYFETQYEVEKVKNENEAKKIQALASELSRERELQQQQLQKQQQQQTNSSNEVQSAPLTTSKSNPHFPDLIHTDFRSHLDYFNPLQSTSAINILESLQSRLKLKEGEIVQLQKEIKNLEKIRESMGKEMVSLTNRLDQMQEKLNDYPELQEKYNKLNTEYNALLQMYGEKSEETEELRLDLQDVKEMYKLQIEDLLKRSNLN